jgi:hypothetical protein
MSNVPQQKKSKRKDYRRHGHECLQNAKQFLALEKEGAQPK